MPARILARISQVGQSVRRALSPLASELGAVPSAEGMSLGWVGMSVLVVAVALAVVPRAGANPPPLYCHGCYLTAADQCAVYQCTYAYPECPIYVPVKSYKTTLKSDTGHESYCDDSTLCVSSCDANCGACSY